MNIERETLNIHGFVYCMSLASNDERSATLMHVRQVWKE